MTQKEHAVERCKCDIREAESRLREANRNLEEGYKRQVALVDQSKADMEREYARLKEEVERATIKVENEKLWLKLAESDLARGEFST